MTKAQTTAPDARPPLPQPTSRAAMKQRARLQGARAGQRRSHNTRYERIVRKGDVWELRPKELILDRIAFDLAALQATIARLQEQVDRSQSK